MKEKNEMKMKDEKDEKDREGLRLRAERNAAKGRQFLRGGDICRQFMAQIEMLEGKALVQIALAESPFALRPCSMVQNNQESRWKYRVTRLFVGSFACITHSFLYSALLTLLACSAALIRLLTHSLAHSLAHS